MGETIATIFLAWPSFNLPKGGAIMAESVGVVLFAAAGSIPNHAAVSDGSLFFPHGCEACRRVAIGER